MNARFVLAVARREARASRRRFALYGGCMALGIAALVGLHGLRDTVSHTVDGESQRLLGADLRLSSRSALDAERRSLVGELEALGGTPAAQMTRFGSMGLATRSGRTRLVDVQAVDGGYPFYGAIRTDPADRWAALPREDRLALVDGSLLVQLDLEVGETLRLGDAEFVVAGAITRAPGTFGIRTQVAPRVFIARRHVAETGLLREGSMVEHLLFLRIEAPAALTAWLERNRPALEAGGVRVQTVSSYRDELARTFGALTRYLGLVGLASLALGGIGVAAGVRVLVREKLDTVAVLRSLGARSRDVLAAYGMLALALGAAAGVAGAGLGLALQWTLPTLLGGLLPTEVSPRIEPGAIATGIGLGLWVTTLFALGPLIDLSQAPPLRALRRDFASEASPQRGRSALVGALALSLLGASLWEAPSPLVGLGFAAGLGATLALLTAAAWGAAAFLRRHRPRRAPFWLRQGIANLFRPRNHTVATTLAVGFGLFLVSTLHAVQHNVLRQMSLDARPDRPNLVFLDVQRDQVAPLEAFLAERGAAVLERAPLVSARISALEGRDAADWLADEGVDRDFRWALRREYRLSWSAELRESERVVAGRWWESEAPPGQAIPVSLETGIAEVLGAEPGDALRWEIQGVPIETVVQSLRKVDWGRFATNFFAIFPPGVLEEAPRTSVLLTRVADAGERAALQRDLVERFPNISSLDVSLILRALDSLIREMGTAVRLLAFVTLATGLAILMAAAATARHERTREGLLLRTLGASSRDVRLMVASEALALGLLACSVGSILALVASWALVRFVFELPFDPPVRNLTGLAAATLLVTLVVGAAGGRAAQAQSPLAGLRQAELSGTG